MKRVVYAYESGQSSKALVVTLLCLIEDVSSFERAISITEGKSGGGEGTAKTKDERLRYRVYGRYPVSVSRADYLNGTSFKVVCRRR